MALWRGLSTSRWSVNAVNGWVIKMPDRDYKEEYRKYHGTEKYKKDRAARNNVRRKAIRDGKIKKGSKMDIDHKDGNPRNNHPSNLRIVHRSVNRAKH